MKIEIVVDKIHTQSSLKTTAAKVKYYHDWRSKYYPKTNWPPSVSPHLHHDDLYKKQNKISWMQSTVMLNNQELVIELTLANFCLHFLLSYYKRR